MKLKMTEQMKEFHLERHPGFILIFGKNNTIM